MQYYEIEEDDTLPTINKITESKAALANGLLGFQMNLVYSTSTKGIKLGKGTSVSASNSPSDNYLGPCDGGTSPSGACRYRTTDSDQLPVHNVFGEGGGKKCGGDAYVKTPLTLKCEDDNCTKYSGGNGFASGPGLSCEFLHKNAGPCDGGKCGKGGCPSCAEYDSENPYILGYRQQTINNKFYMTGVEPLPCCCIWCPCPFKIEVESQMQTWLSNLLQDNWQLGADSKNQNFYGSRTFSGETPLNANDPFNTKGITTKPIFDTDYDIQPFNCNSTDGTCTGNRCTQNPANGSEAVGWINGEWTFPLTTQSTSPTPNKQDTLNYMSARWGKDAMTNELKSPPPPINLVPIPTLPPNTYAGLALWLRDLVNSVQTTYSSDQGPGFIRDYMIVKTFASMYCSTLYGSVNITSLSDPTNVFPWLARAKWNYDAGAPDFVNVWQGEQLVGDSPTASFGKILMSYIGTSFGVSVGANLPFLTQLRGTTSFNQQLDPFPTNDDGVVYLQVPVDAFRMQQLVKNTSTITVENFNNVIVTPLIRGNPTINGIITPNTKQGSSPEPLPLFATNTADSSLDATYMYSGLTYVNPTTVFTTSSKTSSTSYNSQIINFKLSDIDKDFLWPLNTHATINSKNQVVPEDGGNGTPMIECLYYIKVEIKQWSPALAFLYLATKEGRKVIPEKVYQKIYADTTLVSSKYVGTLCSNPDGTNDMTQCRTLITQQCGTRYVNSNFSFSPDGYFLLYNGRNSQGVCACINSSLVPADQDPSNNRAAMCFDQNCSKPIPHTSPTITMNELLGLTDWSCRSECSNLSDLLKGQASNIQNLNEPKVGRLCGQTITMTFNTAFFVQLMIPTIIITSLVPLGFGINKASIIVMVLTLLTLTGVSFYLGKLFASRTECDTIAVGGKLPLCVSSMNPDMELPLSFCNINMFCECRFDSPDCNTGCTCKSGVCVVPGGTRDTETVYVKTINVQMLVLSSSLLILVPILFHLTRKRFFPKLPAFFEFCIIVLSISIFGTVLYLSLVYKKPRLAYKGICGKKKTPGPGPGPTSVCDTKKFSPTILEQPGLPIIGYFPCDTTVTLSGDEPVTYKCPNGGFTCRELLKKTYPNATDDIGCLGLYKNANSDFCSVQYQDPNEGSFGPYTKKTGCNPVLANVVECSQ